MNGRYGSALDRRTPQPTPALLGRHHGAQQLRRQAWCRSSPVWIPRRYAGPQRRLQPEASSGVRIDAPPSRYHSRGDVPRPPRSAIGPVLAGHLAGQRCQVDAQRRPTRGHLDPALVAVAELHARAVDQQQPGGRRADVHRHRMPLAGRRPPYDGQVQLRLLFDRDPAIRPAVEETLRVCERRGPPRPTATGTHRRRRAAEAGRQATPDTTPPRPAARGGRIVAAGTATSPGPHAPRWRT